MITHTKLKEILQFEGHEPESENDISELEELVGFKFPETLKKIWSIEAECALLIQSSFVGQVGIGLFGVKDARIEYVSESIWESVQDNSENFPEGVIPFGGEGNGDLFVLDYRLGQEPLVMMYNHEVGLGDDTSFCFLALNFDEFIDRGFAENADFYVEKDSLLTTEQLSEIIGFSAEGTFKSRARIAEEKAVLARLRASRPTRG